jgi:hypothetical protein
MLARDTAEMRAALAAAIAKVAADMTGAQAGDETGPGRCYSGATVDAELAFALYREACARGLHHTSIEAQAIADVDRFRHASDFASLADAALAERARLARAFARPHRWLRVLVGDVNRRAQVRTASDRFASFIVEIDETRQPLELRLDAFMVQWWPTEPPITRSAIVALAKPPARRATTKPATKRRGTVR